MGRNKFGPQRGPWADLDWQGWWGDEPPFHFVEGEPAQVLARAKEAAQGRDVRLGGSPTTIRQFLEADLVDTLHVAVAPVEIGTGVRLWESPEELRGRYHLEVVPSSSGVTHHIFWRR